MKYFIASAITNVTMVHATAEALNAEGHVLTYDWTKNSNLAAKPEAEKMQIAADEIAAVESSDLVIVLLPGKLGSHIEIGASIANAKGKRILLYSADGAQFEAGDSFCIFYYHPAVERYVGSFDSFLAYLRENF